MKLIEFEKIANLLSRQHKIKVIEGNSWAANTQGREVFYRKIDIYELPEDHILGLLLHEIAHIHYTDTPPLQPQNPEITAVTINMLEDIVVEIIIGKDYPNAGEILESTKTEVLDTLMRILPKMEDISKHEKALLYAAIKFEGRGFKNGKNEYEIVGKSHIPTQLFWGVEDITIPYAHHKFVIQAIPQAQFHSIEDAAHIPFIDQPNKVNPLLLQFLKTLW